MALARLDGHIVNNIKYIDPTDMTLLEASILQQFLLDQLERGLGFVKADAVYKDFNYTHPRTGHQATCDLEFDYGMAWYMSDKYPDQDRFAVLGNTCVGSGGTAEVFKVKGKLKQQSSGALFYVSNKSQPTNKNKSERSKYVAKIERHTERWTHEDTLHGYDLAKRNKHLGLKYPIFFAGDNVTVTMMKRLKDRNLEDVLKLRKVSPTLFDETITNTRRWELYELFKLEEHGFVTWTLFDRLLYSRVVLEAYNEQLRDTRVVHRDIKAENITLDLSDMIPKAVFFDFGCARDISEFDYCEVYGSPGYIAPEILEKKGAYSQNSDVYSLGCVLAQFWGDVSSYEVYPEGDELGYQQSIARRFDGLSDETPAAVRRILNKTVLRDPEKRPSSDEVLAIYVAEINDQMDDILSLTPKIPF